MPSGPMKAMFLRACGFDRDGSCLSALSSLPFILEKSKPSKVLGAFWGMRLRLSGVWMTLSRCFCSRYSNAPAIARSSAAPRL